MGWSEEEKKALGRAFIETMRANGNEHATQVLDGGWYEGFCAIAYRAVELAAARGGTMTVAEIVALFEMPWVVNRVPMERVQAHISTLAARNAVLDAEVAKLKEQLGVAHMQATDFQTEIGHLRERCDDLEARRLAAEEGNRELVRRAQKAEANERRQNGVILALRQSEADAKERTRIAEARCATLSAAGQLLSAHVDHVTDARLPSNAHPHFGAFPCSPTCAHDDAAKPGHPERSEAVNAMHPNGSCTCAGEGTCEWCDRMAKSAESAGYDEGLTKGYDDGAEAMRAACWEAVHAKLQGLGFVSRDAVFQDLKSAIEGAVP